MVLYLVKFSLLNQQAVLNSAKKKDGFTGNGYTRYVDDCKDITVLGNISFFLSFNILDKPIHG